MAKKLKFKPVYSTDYGKAYCADSLDYLKTIENETIDLIVTSPPYALHFKKEYGNANQDKYIEWFLPFAKEFRRILKPTGSFVLNIGGTWTPKHPTRSLYVYKLLIELCESADFKFIQEFFWYNPAKMPTPAEWVTVRKIRVKDAVEYIFWLSPTENPKADNRKVLNPYSKDMERLIKKGVSATKRPSGHNITTKFAEDKGGSIPPNILQFGNNESNSNYIKLTKHKGQKVHPARYPSELPRFFIKFLTDENDLVLDPFAGSNMTGFVSEELKRKWISIDKDNDYVLNSHLRFDTKSLIQMQEDKSQNELLFKTK